MSLGHWNWFKEKFEIKDYVGFVYLIEHIPTSVKYVGQKKFFNKKTLKPLKGKKNKRHKLVESDWKEYTSSSTKLNDLLKKNLKNEFKFSILHLCKSKWMLNYLELYEQIVRNVLFKEEYLNEMVNIRQSKAPKGALEEFQNATKVIQ
jgi:hypothetical protein